MSRTRGKTAPTDEQDTKLNDNTDVINEDNCDVSDKNGSSSSEDICTKNNNENNIKSATTNSGQLVNLSPENVQSSNCGEPQQPPPPAPSSVTSDQIDISMNSKCSTEVRDGSPQPGSLDSSSSVNTVIFNGASDHPDISELDSLSSLNKDTGLQIQLQTNGHHINSSE